MPPESIPKGMIGVVGDWLVCQVSLLMALPHPGGPQASEFTDQVSVNWPFESVTIGLAQAVIWGDGAFWLLALQGGFVAVLDRGASQTCVFAASWLLTMTRYVTFLWMAVEQPPQ